MFSNFFVLLLLLLLLFLFQLSSQSDVAMNAVKIFDILVYYLVTDHIDYAIEIGLQSE